MKTDSEKRDTQADPGKPAAGQRNVSRVSKSIRKRAEKKRSQPASIEFTNIIEKVNEGFVAFDGQLNYLYLNERGGKLLKRRAADLIGKNFWDEYPHSRDTSFGKAYLQALETRAPIQLEDYDALTERWFEKRIYPSENGLSIFFNDVTERKQAEQAMRQNEDRFQMLANGSPVLLWVNGLEGCEFVNREYLSFLGVGQETDVRGYDWSEFVHPDDRQAYVAAYLHAFEQEAMFGAEFRFRRHDGQYRWMRSEATPRRAADGQFLGYVGASIDITDRRQAEEQLRQSEERFRQAADASGGLVYEVELGSGATAVVHGMKNLVGYDPQETEMTSNWWHSLIHPEDLPAHLTRLEAHLAKGGTDLSEYRVQHKNGSWITVQDNRLVIQDETGQADRLIGAVIDMSERKRAEDERIRLLRSEQEQRATAEQAQGKAEQATARAESELRERKMAEEALGRWSGQPLPHETRPIWMRYGMGLLVTALAIALRMLFQPVLGEFIPFATIFGAVAFSVWYGGIGPAILSIIAGFLGIQWLIIEPHYMLSLDQANIVALGLFLLSNLVVISLGEEMRRAQRHAHQSAQVAVARQEQAQVQLVEQQRAELTLKEYARQQEALYTLANELHQTTSFADIFSAALDAVLSALQCDRASILLFDNADVMRFVAWRGLSEAYRQATDGHSPWKPDEQNPVPICMNDVHMAELSGSLRSVIQEEGIGSLAFIPLVSRGKLIGKFMTYFNAPHDFDEDETDLSLTIARQLAVAVQRKWDEDELRRAREQAEKTADRIARLQQITVALSGPAVPSRLELAEIVLKQGTEASDAVAGILVELLDNGQDLHTLAALGYPASAVRTEPVPLSAPTPMSDCIRTGQALWIRSHADFAEQYPELAELRHSLGNEATAVLPLIVGDKVLGGLAFSFLGTHAFEMDDQEFFLAVAQRCAQALERARTQELLKTERELLERLFETMPVMVSVFDPATNTMRFNAEFERLIGWKSDELTVASLLEALYPDPEYRTKILQRMATAGSNEWIEVQVRTRDGRILDSLWSNVSIMSNGQLVTGLAIGIDIAERKRVENELRASEQLYRAIARSIPGGGVYVVDKDFRYMVAEGPVTEAFGLSREMLEGHTVAEVFSPEPSARMEERLRRNFAGETVNFETKHNGRTYWTQQAPLLDSLGSAIIVTIDITERKQAEEALSQSQERFSRFMQHLPGLAWIKDQQGRYVYANAAAEQAFHASGENLYGRTDWDIFPPEVAAQFVQNDQLAVSEGRGIQVVETLQHAEDGVLHYSLVSKFPIPGPDGGPVLIGGTAFDITERKQAEEDLKRSEERERVRAAQLEAIMEAVPAVIWIAHDPDGHLVTGNRASYEVLRLSFGGNASLSVPEGIKPSHFEVWHDGRPLQPDELPVQRAARGDEAYNFEEEVRFEDGTSVHLLGNAITLRDAQNNPTGALAAFLDITGRKRVEEELRQLNLELESRVEMRTIELSSANERLKEENEERAVIEEALRESDETTRLILDTSPDVILIANQQGHIRRVNAQIEKLFGYQAGEVVGKPIETLIPSRFHKRHIEHRAYYGSHRHRRPMGLGMELFGQHKDGTEFSVDVMLTPIHNIADWDTMVTIRDSTERRRMEEALRENHRRLQTLSRRLVEVQEEERRAIARELHDRVGQNLAALNLNLTIINNQLSTFVNEQVNARLADSTSLVAELIALVRDVMSDLRPAVLDDYGLEAALETNLEKFKSRYGIAIQFERNKSPLPRLDSSIEMTLLRIAQEALLNVVRHAFADQVIFSLFLDKDVIRLKVQDNGMGIQSWQNVNRPGSHGLTIMQERAEAVGGKLSVASTPGQGTQIEASIPVPTQTTEEKRE